jgi:hypothetical protein
MPSLADVIADVETGGNQFAERFEPAPFIKQWQATALTGYNPIIDAIQKIHAAAYGTCSHGTAMRICFTSFGRYQIMGFNIWGAPDFPYRSTYQSYQENVPAQDGTFLHFLNRAGINFTLADLVADGEKAKKFVTTYNGPGGWPIYWQRMQQSMRRLGA